MQVLIAARCNLRHRPPPAVPLARRPCPLFCCRFSRRSLRIGVMSSAASSLTRSSCTVFGGCRLASSIRRPCPRGRVGRSICDAFLRAACTAPLR